MIESFISQLRPFLLHLALAFVMVLPGGCTGEGAVEVEDDAVLTLYSGRAQALVQPTVDAFTEQTGIRVRVNYADTSQLVATLLEEGARSPADVFFAQDAASLGILETERMLVPQDEALQARVHEHFRSRRHTWIGISGRARVLSWNPDTVDASTLPTSVDELTDEKWRGRVGWAPTNASFQAFIGAMIELRGEDATREWIEAMVANDARAFPANTPAVLAVSSGEVDVALTNHYYQHRLRAEQGERIRVENHYFANEDAASMLSVSAAGILETSENRELAQRFIEHLLSDEAQLHFTHTNFEFPLADSVKARDSLPTLDAVRPPALDLSTMDNVERSVRLLRSAGAMP